LPVFLPPAYRLPGGTLGSGIYGVLLAGVAAVALTYGLARRLGGASAVEYDAECRAIETYGLAPVAGSIRVDASCCFGCFQDRYDPGRGRQPGTAARSRSLP
jgi:hypothetical protein